MASSRRPTRGVVDARNKGLRATGRSRIRVGYCVHKARDVPTDNERMYQQNHVRMHKSVDGGHSDGDHGRPADGVRFARRCTARPRHVLRRSARSGHGRVMPDGQAAVWRTRDPATRAEARARLPEREDTSVLREAWRSTRSTRPASTSHEHGQLFASNDEGTAGVRLRATCRRSHRSKWRSSGSAMADLHLPATLPPLFATCRARRGRRGHRRRAFVRLDERWPGSRPASRAGPALRRTSTSTSTASARNSDTRSSALAGRRDRRSAAAKHRASSST